jgi:hypothetical protein
LDEQYICKYLSENFSAGIDTWNWTRSKTTVPLMTVCGSDWFSKVAQNKMAPDGPRGTTD